MRLIFQKEEYWFFVMNNAIIKIIKGDTKEVREVQNIIKETVNKIELVSELIKDQLEDEHIDKINFDDLIIILKEAEVSLEQAKGLLIKK